MFRLGLVDTLVTHANKEGFGLTPLSGDRPRYMPPLLKTKQKNKYSTIFFFEEPWEPLHFLNDTKLILN